LIDANGDPILIQGRPVGRDAPAYIIAELSANHGHSYDRALELVHAAHAAGADAVKLQTYTAETMTIDTDAASFRIDGTVWDGRNLFELYQEAYTPWEWQPELKRVADTLGMHLFSTPFDASSVRFLEGMDVPAYKIASFELVDLPLLRLVAETGKPVILSTGMATLAEIDEAVNTLREAGCRELALLKCTSAYPAAPSEMNLQTIPYLAEHFRVPVGLSDHSLDLAVPVAATILGASIIEKHITLSRADPGPDSGFSLEPEEFAAMVAAVRAAEEAVGSVTFGGAGAEQSSRAFRRSIFVVEDVRPGEIFTEHNLRVIRPGAGLHPRYFERLLGATAAREVPRGTPLAWDHVADRSAE
jgi:pseudaminic acid synthase